MSGGKHDGGTARGARVSRVMTACIDVEIRKAAKHQEGKAQLAAKRIDIKTATIIATRVTM